LTTINYDFSRVVATTTVPLLIRIKKEQIKHCKFLWKIYPELKELSLAYKTNQSKRKKKPSSKTEGACLPSSPPVKKPTKKLKPKKEPPKLTKLETLSAFKVKSGWNLSY